jgi:protein-tyrosine phosphatase
MSILSRFFQKSKLPAALSFESLHTDMHSHLVPGIDDGVKDMETALALVRKLNMLGFKKLVTTPHIMVDIYKNTPEIIRQGVSDLNQAILQANIDIRVEAAAEYQLDEGMLKLLEDGSLMTLGDKYLLIELPYYNAPDFLNTVLFELQVAGYSLILAHPERYVYWHQQFSKLEDLKSRNILFQLNTISLGGFYSHPTKKTAEKLIDAGMIDFLGSDLHNMQYVKLLEATMYEPYLEKVLSSGKLQNHLL